MTDERNTMNTGADTDAVVTQTYRDTASERAPESLNRVILDQAAKAARPRYSRLVSWTRPMAWAATVMMSVAIVLQLTQAPAPESVDFEDRAIELEAPASVTVDRLEEAVASDEEPSLTANDAADPGPKAESFRANAKQVAPAASSAARQRLEQSKATVAEQEQAAPELDTDDFKLKDQDMLQRADDMARMQEGSNLEAAPVNAAARSFSADGAVLRLVNEPDISPACDEIVTASAESWLQCIAALEEAGLTDAAREERKLLATAFPDVDVP